MRRACSYLAASREALLERFLDLEVGYLGAFRHNYVSRDESLLEARGPHPRCGPPWAGLRGNVGLWAACALDSWLAVWLPCGWDGLVSASGGFGLVHLAWHVLGWERRMRRWRCHLHALRVSLSLGLAPVSGHTHGFGHRVLGILGPSCSSWLWTRVWVQWMRSWSKEALVPRAALLRLPYDSHHSKAVWSR